MANRYAVATGNWSNVATWDGGTTLPQAADSVCANGYTVTIDQDVTVVLITTAALGSGAAGGSFAVSTARTITANITAGSTTCITASHASGNTVTVNGNVTGGGNSAYGVNNSSTGAVSITGNVTGGGGTSAYGLYNSTNCTITITGNVTGGSGYSAWGMGKGGGGIVEITGNISGGSAGVAYGFYNFSSSSITITGNVTGGTNTTTYGFYNVEVATIVITGNVTAGNGTGAVGVYNTAASTITITGDITASSNNSGFFSSAYGGHLRLDGSIYAHASGWCGVSAPRIGYVTATDEITQYPEAGAVAPNFSGNLVTHYGASQGVFGQAGIANVRNGTVYGPSNELTGTCHVPAAASVLYGVPVDATIGTAAVTSAAIGQAVRSELATELTRIDVAISTRATTGSSMVLSASGLDSVLIESGISAGASLTNDTGTQITSVNARQAIAAILAAGAGVLSGVSNNAPAFKPGGKASGNTRISATVTSDGRTAVNLKVPD